MTDPDFDSVGNAFVLRAGQRFGELTVVGFSHSDRGNWWLLRCDCGNDVTRAMSAIAHGVRTGSRQSCGSCARELAGGLTMQRRATRQKLYREQFLDGLSLWSAPQLARMQRDIRDEIGRALGVMPETESPPDVPLCLSPERFTPEKQRHKCTVCRVARRIRDSNFCSIECANSALPADRTDPRGTPEYAALFQAQKRA